MMFFYIASGIASLPQGLGSLLGKTVALAYGSTVIIGIGISAINAQSLRKRGDEVRDNVAFLAWVTMLFVLFEA